MLVTKTNDLVICLRDFDADTGPSCSTLAGLIGPFKSETANDNFDRLISFCQGAQLTIIARFLFSPKDTHCYTWLFNDGRNCKKIKHILANRKWIAVTNCRLYRKLELDSDHGAVIGLSV